MSSDKVNLELRKLKNELGAEFIEYMELQTFNGYPINRKDFRDNFNKQYPNVAKFNTPQKFKCLFIAIRKIWRVDDKR